ncbi:hypothetical protein ACFORG_18455 [Lutimaribacter marinistellae]|uniref:Lipoprotein n=1 Tax=Lutimaribacter marinistellae TaxID=1820329 RepID=A0ABV7TKD2_9RHOB
MHGMKAIVMFAAMSGVVLSAGCGERRENRVLFDGLYFPSKAAAVDKKVSLADFTVTVQDATQSLDAAREAGRYQATRYCIDNFGTSRVDWVVGPDSDASQLRIVDGDLVFRGTCQRP